MQLLRDLAAIEPDRLHVADETASYTRVEFNELVNRVAGVMRGLDLRARDRIGIYAHNSADWVAVASAAALSGCTPVPINTHLGRDELRQLIGIGRLDALFTDVELAVVARDAASELGLAAERVVVIGDVEWRDRLAGESGAEPPIDSTVASPIYFTSGTTGVPKGTRMSQVPDDIDGADYLARMRPLWAQMRLGPATRHLVTGPLYHSSPGASLTGVVNAGGSVWVMRRYEAESSLRAIEAYRINLIGAVPTHFVRWLQVPSEIRDAIDLSSLELVTHTAAICSVPVKRAMIEWLGPILIEGYGGSELGAMTAIDSATWLDHPGSVGRALPGLEVGIFDETGAQLSPGEVGRIFARGRGMEIEYLDDPVKTAASFVGEWFTLGDLGWLDDDGYLFIADRRDDLIVSGGVNVYPAEIESVLGEHPAVGDVAVIGIPDDEWGALVLAVVEPRAGTTGSPELERELIEFCRQRLASFKCPRAVHFRDRLPRHDNGKLYRRLLRDEYQAVAQ